MSARNGILVRNREAFERARNLTVIAFDKTGTLTEGRPELTDVHVADGFSETQVIALAASLGAPIRSVCALIAPGAADASASSVRHRIYAHDH